MSSLEQRIDQLEQDVLADPPRISAYHDLPFAILHYDPTDEFLARKQFQMFATRLRNAGRRVHAISVARLVWQAIRDTEGIQAVAEDEQQFGFNRAQETVAMLLSDDAFSPLPDQIERRMKGLDPKIDVVFLLRIASLAPAIYRSAKLLDEMHGRTMVPILLFYPGTLDGENSLRFMDLSEREQTGAYRDELTLRSGSPPGLTGYAECDRA
jgi:hypothetical protein